jgi:hypothetical protein
MDAVSPAQAYRQRRTADELYQRALDGPPFYAIGALIVGLLSARSAWHAVLVGTAIGLFGLIGWQRIRHRPPASTTRRWPAGKGSTCGWCIRPG